MQDITNKGATKLARARTLRTGQPLQLAALRQAAPAIFAEQAYHKQSASYAYVPTIEVVQTLLDNGFGIYEAAQQRSRTVDRDPYTKHMLRLRHLEHWGTDTTGLGGVPEVVLVNAHDGTAAYHMYAGFFRMVCSNGLMAGVGVAAHKVRHTHAAITKSQVLTAGLELVTEQFPEMLCHITSMRQASMQQQAQLEYAQLALRLRYGTMVPPFAPEQLLAQRRDDDAGNDVWSVYNRVQENLLTGGFATRSALFNRASKVRPVERVSNVVQINRGLWDLAMDAVAEV